MMKVLIVESEFLNQDTNTYVGTAVERLANELTRQDVEVLKATSFEDGYSILSANEAIDCLMFSRNMDNLSEQTLVQELLNKLHERQENVPVFLLSDREKATQQLSREMMEQIDEFAWILEDTAEFIAGRAVAAMKRYNEQLLPPLMSALMKYGDVHEYSWAAPGHQGGVGFTKTPAGRFYHDYYGENLFRTDMGIERASLGSLLDHTGAFGESEKNAARIFGADHSYSLVVGTSGANRTIMQACMSEDDVVVIDRNCHKSIEQGLMLTGAKPVYMVPSRNRYGIIGPIYPQQMTPDAIKEKIANSPLTKDKIGQQPSYSVVTNCTYDGVCYNAKAAQDLLAKTTDRIHFDEAWYGYARFNPMYHNHYTMRGEPAEYDRNGPTLFATHSTHKLLNALSQASYIHVRDGREAINFARFNQAYMMHATTSPLYAICASNDVAASMMDGNRGLSLTQEVINEAVDFRQAMARLYKEFAQDGEWFFKPWNQEVVTDPATGKQIAFEDAPAELLRTEQSCWTMNPGDNWHGFKDLPENWSMLDPIKVSILAPGMGDDGELQEKGVPAALVTAWLSRHGIVPTRTTDFQVMFLFSMGVTKGKWGTLVNTLLSFKRHYDANTKLSLVLPELVRDYPETYSNLGLRDLGDNMFAYLRKHNPGAKLNAAYSGLPDAMVTPRQAYQSIVANKVEMVAIDGLVNRVAANSIIPYPPGIPMLLSGESFGGEESPQIGYLRALQAWDHEFPGFEHETEGTEIINGVYHVMCMRTV
ncbi:MAG: arginine decarboxylase [Aeromonas sp.]